MTTFDLQMLDEAPSGVLIENVQPLVDCGRYPLKREAGDRVDVTADIFREGHDLIAAVIQYKQRGEDAWTEAPMSKGDNDAWAGSFHVDTIGAAQFRVFAWPDHFESWRSELRKKVDAGLEVSSELLEGRNIVEETFVRATDDDRQWMEGILDSAQTAGDQLAAAETMLGDDLAELVHRNANREHAAVAGPYPVYVDRVRARFAAWYSTFPRSAGTVEGQTATFKDVEAQLPRIQKMGFNVLYFTPIHPIGDQKRKGKNNSVVSVPGDPGVPYAIGSKDGGHDAVEPGLGTWDDFDELVSVAEEHGMEIALDLAIQASPDHPWVTEHPEWFFIRPDGTIKYAENPPKKYEDIYPINFNQSHWRELYEEIYRIIMVWVQHGVKSIRVDNPHTKPTAFWEWLIAKVHATNPEVIFLSEAFTRPKVMKALAKAGFAQSYTYFTWRNYKHELVEYARELTQTEMKEFFRGNFFTNTHVIIVLVGGIISATVALQTVDVREIDIDGTQLSVDEEAYYEYVAPRLEMLVAEVETTREMVETKSRDILALTRSGNVIETLTGEIRIYGEDNVIPVKFANVHDQILDASNTVNFTFEEARTALRTFNFSSMSDLVVGFGDAADMFTASRDDLNALVPDAIEITG